MYKGSRQRAEGRGQRGKAVGNGQWAMGEGKRERTHRGNEEPATGDLNKSN